MLYFIFVREVNINMARPKEFVPEQVLRKVMDHFWKKGYNASSIEDILMITGIGRKSLYDTFGDKRALYLAALNHYGQTFGWRLEQLCHQSGNIRDVFRLFFQTIVDESLSDPDRRGCFMVNASLEMAPHDSEVAKRVQTGLDKTREAFYRLLITAQAAGELALSLDPHRLASYFLNAYIGLRILARSKPERRLLEDVVSTTVSVLE